MVYPESKPSPGFSNSPLSEQIPGIFSGIVSISNKIPLPEPSPNIDNGSRPKPSSALDNGSRPNATSVLDNDSLSEHNGFLHEPTSSLDNGTLPKQTSVRDNGSLTKPTSGLDNGSLTESTSVLDNGSLTEPTSVLDNGSLTEPTSVLDNGSLTEPTSGLDNGSLTEPTSGLNNNSLSESTSGLASDSLPESTSGLENYSLPESTSGLGNDSLPESTSGSESDSSSAPSAGPKNGPLPEPTSGLDTGYLPESVSGLDNGPLSAICTGLDNDFPPEPTSDLDNGSQCAPSTGLDSGSLPENVTGLDNDPLPKTTSCLDNESLSVPSAGLDNNLQLESTSVHDNGSTDRYFGLDSPRSKHEDDEMKAALDRLVKTTERLQRLFLEEEPGKGQADGESLDTVHSALTVNHNEGAEATSISPDADAARNANTKYNIIQAPVESPATDTIASIEQPQVVSSPTRSASEFELYFESLFRDGPPLEKMDWTSTSGSSNIVSAAIGDTDMSPAVVGDGQSRCGDGLGVGNTARRGQNSGALLTENVMDWQTSTIAPFALNLHRTTFQDAASKSSATLSAAAFKVRTKDMAVEKMEWKSSRKVNRQMKTSKKPHNMFGKQCEEVMDCDGYLTNGLLVSAKFGNTNSISHATISTIRSFSFPSVGPKTIVSVAECMDYQEQHLDRQRLDNHVPRSDEIMDLQVSKVVGGVSIANTCNNDVMLNRKRVATDPIFTDGFRSKSRRRVDKMADSLSKGEGDNLVTDGGMKGCPGLQMSRKRRAVEELFADEAGVTSAKVRN